MCAEVSPAVACTRGSTQRRAACLRHCGYSRVIPERSQDAVFPPGILLTGDRSGHPAGPINHVITKSTEKLEYRHKSM